MELRRRRLTSNSLLLNRRNLNNHIICSRPPNNLLRLTISNTITSLNRGTPSLLHTLLTRNSNRGWLGDRAYLVHTTNHRFSSSNPNRSSMDSGVQARNLCIINQSRLSNMVLVQLRQASIRRMASLSCFTSRRCTIIPRRSRKSSTSNQETSSPLPRPLRMVGGAVSCWMRRGGNPGDMYSRATLFVCSDISSLFILNSPSNTHRIHAVEVYILLSARYVLAYIHRHPFPPGLMGPSFSVTLF